ncbi:MAG: hypothetical protein WCO34_07865 [Betaproteobacteria bacterium]
MITLQLNTNVISKPGLQSDFLRFKCGYTDFFVIDEIDLQLLRQLQRIYLSLVKLLKPVPDGFEIDFGRKVLPEGENE